MEGSSSRGRTCEEDSSPPFPLKIDLSPLKSYFDRLEMKLKVPVLHTINDEVTVRVQRLIDKQETVSHKCHLILKKFFNVPIVGNPKVSANNWQEVAALNLLVAWFTSEEKRIEKNLDELFTFLICLEMITDIDIRPLSILDDHVMEDSRIVKVPTIKDKEVSVQEQGHRECTEEMKTMAEGHEDGDSSGQAHSDAVCVQELKSELRQVVDKIFHQSLLGGAKVKRKERRKRSHAWNEDCEKLNRILTKASKLDNQIAPTFADLFFLLKMYDLEITKISQFKASLEQSRTGEDEPRFIEKIMDLIELADKELNRVKQWRIIEGVDNDLTDRTPQGISGEITKVDKLLDELTRLMLSLERFRRFRGLSEPRTEDVVMLQKILEDTVAELIDIDAKFNRLKVKVKEGRFIEVVRALGHAANNIESIQI